MSIKSWALGPNWYINILKIAEKNLWYLQISPISMSTIHIQQIECFSQHSSLGLFSRGACRRRFVGSWIALPTPCWEPRSSGAWRCEQSRSVAIRHQHKPGRNYYASYSLWWCCWWPGWFALGCRQSFFCFRGKVFTSRSIYFWNSCV